VILCIQAYRLTGRLTGLQVHRQAYRLTGSQAGLQAYRFTGRLTGLQKTQEAHSEKTDSQPDHSTV
jgi:hypothetical protein